MKKISVIMIFLLIYLSGHSQEVKNQQNPTQNQKNQSSRDLYSSYNLWKASPEELKLYLNKAQGKKTTGIGLTIAGSVMMVGGITWAGVTWGQKGLGIALAGLASAAIGIPFWVSGSKQHEKVNREFQKRARLSFNIAPDLIFTNKGENSLPGLTLKIGF